MERTQKKTATTRQIPKNPYEKNMLGQV